MEDREGIVNIETVLPNYVHYISEKENMSSYMYERASSTSKCSKCKPSGKPT